MRTTIDLPEDVHLLATAIARDAGTSLSETVTRLLRASLGASGRLRLEVSPQTGLTVFRGGGVTTSADVRALEDEE